MPKETAKALAEWLKEEAPLSGEIIESAIELAFVNFNRKNEVEQRIIGMEMVVEKFGHDFLYKEFEVTPNQIYNYCDELFDGDSQHIRGKYNVSKSA